VQVRPLTIIRTGVDAYMSEPPKSQRPLPELVAFFGAPDEIEPINTHLFGRKLAEIIARARANMRSRRDARRKRKAKPRNEFPEGSELS
jgi:hypothetical protein